MQNKSYGPATPVARQVSALGLGAAQLGDEAVSETQASHLLNTALDLGMTLIDTARGYGQSEARIGRHLAHRRSEYTLSTKVGYGIEGQTDWTPAIIEAGVDAALNVMRTDHIDIVHLHSCPIGTLQHSGVVEALMRLLEKGKIGTAAYSGDNAELAWAVASGAFGGIECSINLFDQANLPAIAAAHAKGLGVIAKRTLGNAPWRFAQQPVGHYCETYWQRMQALAYDTTGLPWDELALRFCLGWPEITCAIVGTSSEVNLRHNVQLAERGPLPAATMVAVRDRFAAMSAVSANWPAEI